MNSNLRNMIEDALDGGLSHEETYSYNSDVDMSHVYGDGEIEKLASALNYVATNLDDLGTTDEKLAELELLQEKLATAEATTAATEAAEDGFGAFAKNLKGGSGVSLGEAFGKLSTGRKVALGGGAGLVGLGALYGGYKMLGGGSQPSTNVVKVSSLQDAKAIALTKMAQRYDIPVYELEKIALTPAQGGILHGMINPDPRKGGPSQIAQVSAPGEGATKEQIAAYKKYQQQMAQRQRTAKTLLGQNSSALTEESRKAIQAYAEGGAMDPTTAKSIRADIAANPTANSGVIQSGDRVLGQRQAMDAKGNKLVYTNTGTPVLATSRNHQGKVVSGKFVEATRVDGSKVKVPAAFTNISPEKLEAGIKDGTIKTFEAKTGQELANERIAVSEQRQAQLNTKNQKKKYIKTFNEKVKPGDRLDQKAARGANQEIATIRNKLMGPIAEKESDSLYKYTKEVLDRYMTQGADALNTAERRILKARFGPNYQIVIANAMTKSSETAERLAEQTRRASGTKGGRQTNTRSAATQNKRTGGLNVNKAAAEAGEKELGFLAKNRRALLGAGALGAAGLAGYGAYKAFGGGGQSKAASYRGMRKIAEDRINPARIKAGAAHRFSGMDIHAPGMSRSASPYEPIGIKAQRIRDTINRDMKGYVNHVGGGYNLDNYLNRFNK